MPGCSQIEDTLWNIPLVYSIRSLVSLVIEGWSSRLNKFVEVLDDTLLGAIRP